MADDTVWLGRFRGPVYILMIGFSAVAVLVFTWLVLSNLLFADAVGMHEMIRPAGRPIVMVMLASLAGALLFASLYLSDTVGAIEPKPTGAMDYLSLVCSRLAMIGIAFIVIVMFYEVVSRYLFSRPTLWANELSLWIASFVFLFAGLYAMQQRSHIRIYIVYDIMPRWLQKASDVMSLLLIVGFTFALVWGGYGDAKTRMMRMETFGTAWDPPLPGTVKPAILFIIFLVALQAVSNLIADWKKSPEQHTPMDDIDDTEIDHIRQTLKEQGDG